MSTAKDIEELQSSAGYAFRGIEEIRSELRRMRGGPFDERTGCIIRLESSYMTQDGTFSAAGTVTAIKDFALRLRKLENTPVPARPDRRLLIFLGDTVKIEGTRYKVRNIGTDCFEVVEI
jgi:hypothetical protein